MKPPHTWPDPPPILTAFDAMNELKKRLDAEIAEQSAKQAEVTAATDRLNEIKAQVRNLDQAIDRAFQFWRGDVEPDDTMLEYWKRLLQNDGRQPTTK